MTPCNGESDEDNDNDDENDDDNDQETLNINRIRRVKIVDRAVGSSRATPPPKVRV